MKRGDSESDILHPCPREGGHVGKEKRARGGKARPADGLCAAPPQRPPPHDKMARSNLGATRERERPSAEEKGGGERRKKRGRQRGARELARSLTHRLS